MTQHGKIIESIIHAPELIAENEKEDYVTPVPEATPRITVTFKPAPVNGAPLWAELHRRALKFDGMPDIEWIKAFSARVPCGVCQQHWIVIMKFTPPDWSAYFSWTVNVHNQVNAFLKKPLLTVEEARMIWSNPT